MRKWAEFSLHHISKQFPNEFMVSVAGFKSSSTQHDAQFVNLGSICNKADEIAGYCMLYGVSQN